MHVATTKRIYRSKVYLTHLLRRSFREGNKVKHQTLGNLSHLPPDLIDTIRQRLAGKRPEGQGSWEIVRSLPHGHVAAVLGTLQQIGLDGFGLAVVGERSLVLAMIVMRLIAAVQAGHLPGTEGGDRHHQLGRGIGIGRTRRRRTLQGVGLAADAADADRNQARPAAPSGRNIGALRCQQQLLHGTPCGLVQFGYNRDGKHGFPQIVYGLLCNAEGCPVAIEVFEGNTADPKTLGPQIEKLRCRFGVQPVVLVGDRGMITSKRIDESLRGVEGLDWITALCRQHPETGFAGPDPAVAL